MRRRLFLGMVLLALTAVPAPSTATVRYARVTVSTSATIIFTAPQVGPRARVLVRNPSAVSVYLGDVNVTTANGFEVSAGDAITMYLDTGDSLYGIVAAATQVVHTLSGATP